METKAHQFLSYSQGLVKRLGISCRQASQDASVGFAIRTIGRGSSSMGSDQRCHKPGAGSGHVPYHVEESSMEDNKVPTEREEPGDGMTRRESGEKTEREEFITGFGCCFTQSSPTLVPPLSS
jgi:hypothetical protein